PIDVVNSALVAQKRPERQRGLTATNAAYLIPDAICKRFAQGWKQHVPLHFLTDKYCSRDNVKTTKELDDTYSLDGSCGIITVAKPLLAEPELALNFAEWFQGWARLLELIATYVPNELEDWRTHYERILKKPNKDDIWALCVAYDSEIRRRCCTSGIDPSILHLEIWNDLEVAHMTRVTYEKVSADIAKANRSHQSNNRYHPYLDNSGAAGPSKPTNSFRNSNRLQITGPGVQAQFRCFICGDMDPVHRARRCNARKLVNGKDTIIFARKEGEPRLDRNGASYCYSFNGRAGCDQGANCNHGKHWCTLCGAKDGSHAAQGCPSL
ncbi:hypothetical protein DFH06DRAFT_1006615, partial [Mycena polygramma]